MAAAEPRRYRRRSWLLTIKPNFEIANVFLMVRRCGADAVHIAAAAAAVTSTGGGYVGGWSVEAQRHMPLQ